MIRIRVERQEDGLEISAVGHAGFDRWGRDIVCAGVSALIFGYLAYLESLPSVATTEEELVDMNSFTDSSGDCRNRGEHDSRMTVMYRIGEGKLWIQTRNMKGKDTAAWAVTAAGLFLLAAHYPGHVRLETGKE